jgi:hypothetical protein
MHIDVRGVYEKNTPYCVCPTVGAREGAILGKSQAFMRNIRNCGQFTPFPHGVLYALPFSEDSTNAASKTIFVIFLEIDMNTQSNKTHRFILCITMLICLRSVAFCQDTSRVGLKGLSLGLNLQPLSLGGSGFYGKYWLTDQIAPVAGISFSLYDNSVTYRVNGLPTNRTYFSNISLLAGVEYHLLKNQQFSAFSRITVSTNISTVPGYNSSNIFDSGTFFSTIGIGIEYFIIPRISISVLQSIQLAYAWGNGIASPNNPTLLGDGRTVIINSGLTNFLFHFYF